MIRGTFLILFIITSCSVFSQRNDSLKSSNSIYQFPDFFYKIYFDSKDSLRRKMTLSREIISGYTEQKILIFEKNKLDNNHKFEINLIENPDRKIIYCRIDSMVQGSGYGFYPRTILKDTTNYHQLELAYFNLYARKLNQLDLFREDIVFGFYCGFGGILTSFAIIQKEKIELKDYHTIIEWLKSPVTEIQLFGYDAIYQLKQKGVVFDKKVDVYLELIADKKGWVQFCAGCDGMPQSISDAIAYIHSRHKN
ncbi:MAG: hypothetical protein ACWA41_13150 [Putridiphycobacter sp.]